MIFCSVNLIYTHYTHYTQYTHYTHYKVHTFSSFFLASIHHPYQSRLITSIHTRFYTYTKMAVGLGLGGTGLVRPWEGSSIRQVREASVGAGIQRHMGGNKENYYGVQTSVPSSPSSPYSPYSTYSTSPTSTYTPTTTTIPTPTSIPTPSPSNSISFTSSSSVYEKEQYLEKMRKLRSLYAVA
jgi:hypothetical protein